MALFLNHIEILEKEDSGPALLRRRILGDLKILDNVLFIFFKQAVNCEFSWARFIVVIKSGIHKNSYLGKLKSQMKNFE